MLRGEPGHASIVKLKTLAYETPRRYYYFGPICIGVVVIQQKLICVTPRQGG